MSKIIGIDIYHYDAVDSNSLLQIIRDYNIYFIFIKASTGANSKDDKFVSNWSLSKNEGLVCGAYHFFWPVSNASLQADNFISQIKLVNSIGSIPPVVDIEWTKTNKQSTEYWDNVDGKSRVLIIKEFIQKIELYMHTKPVIYTATSFWEEFITPYTSDEDNQLFADCKIWIADPNSNGKLPAPWKEKGYTFKQNHLGEIASANSGLYEKLDHDEFKNDKVKDFLNLLLPGFTLMRGFPYSAIVKDLQTALQQLDLLKDATDGYFGKNTETALTEFQNSNSLIGNGIVDAQTWNKLL